LLVASCSLLEKKKEEPKFHMLDPGYSLLEKEEKI